MKVKFTIPVAIIFALLLATTTLAGPVSHFGMLKACKVNNKGQLCGEKTGSSTPILIKGASLDWSVGESALFYTPDVVDWFVDNMQIGSIRVAMGIEFLGENKEPIEWVPLGYKADPAGQKAVMKAIIDAAIINDIYVIMDWHSHNAHTSSESALAEAFFKEMAKEYKDVPNLIWEIYNEPMSADKNTVNTYATRIIKAIRDAGSKQLVLIGSPTWSSKPYDQAKTYGSADKATSDNVAFTLHFYSVDHSFDTYAGNAKSAMNDGYAVFCSEWGFSRSDGSGGVNDASNYTGWMDSDKISNNNWRISNIDQTSSMFTTGTLPTAMSTNNFSQSGKNFQTYMGKNKWTELIPAGNPKAGDATVSVKDGESVTIKNLGVDGTIESVSEPKDIGGTVYGKAEISGTEIKYTTATSGSPEKVRFTYTVKKGSNTTQGRVVVNITNLKPKLPTVDPISVSRKAPTKLSLVNQLKATAPKNDKFTVTNVTISDNSKGSVSSIAASNANGDTILFTPSAAMANKNLDEVGVSYTVKNNTGVTSTASVTLLIQNQAPSMQASTAYCTATIEQGTAETRLDIGKHFGGRDKDGDSIWFDAFYLASGYPGSLEKIAPDTLIYKRNGNTNNGKVVLLAYATDGSLTSGLGKVCITLNGSGSAINVTAPTEIPGYVPGEPPVVPISRPVGDALALGMRTLGLGVVEVNFAGSGIAKLEIYSLSGKKVATLLNEHQNAGSKEISLRNLGLQKGVYILRLKQGGQIKTIRIVN